MQKFQFRTRISTLHYPRAYIRLHLSEGRRFNVAHRQAEIRIVENIEQFAAELEFFCLRQSNIFQRREVPVHVSWALDYVATFVAKLLDIEKPCLKRVAPTSIPHDAWAAHKSGVIRFVENAVGGADSSRQTDDSPPPKPKTPKLKSFARSYNIACSKVRAAWMFT